MLLARCTMSLQTPPILWVRQDRHFYFLLFLLSRKARNATTKLPKDISNPIIPMNTKIISAAVMSATSLPMYSGKPVFKAGRLPPCHGCFSVIQILPQFDRDFNQILFSWNIWKVFENQSQINLTSKEKEPTNPVNKGLLAQMFRYSNSQSLV